MHLLHGRSSPVKDKVSKRNLSCYGFKGIKFKGGKEEREMSRDVNEK